MHLQRTVAFRKGQSSAQELALFTDLYNSKLANKNVKARARTAVQADICEAQKEVAAQVKTKKKKLNSGAKKKP